MAGHSALPPAMAREMLADFAREADEIRAKITKDLLLAEQAAANSAPLAKAYKSLARGLHTLKGSAATLGLGDIARTAHQLEDALAPLARSQQPFPATEADGLLGALDGLVKAAQTVAGLITPDVPAPAPNDQAEALVPPQATVLPPPTAVPAVEHGEWYVGWPQLSPIVADVEHLRQIRLRLLDLHQRLQSAIAAVTAGDPDDRLVQPRLLLTGVERALAHEAAGTAYLVETLESSLKEICTVPAMSVLEPLQRAVRDLCRASGKEAKLSIVGGELRVDRRILEALRGPLIHLVRNAVDHGIELPAAREARGKHRAGSLVIRVELQGSLVFLEIADDGGGVDPARVRDSAVGKGS